MRKLQVRVPGRLLARRSGGPAGGRARDSRRARRAWRAVVPLVCLAAGYLFAVSARESRGTDLRPPGTGGLRGLVLAAERQVRQLDDTAAALQRQVDATTRAAGQVNAAVGRAQRRVRPLEVPAGLRAMTGPGLAVTLDDAPPSDATAGVDPNQLVVHQSDLQAVVNALWAGRAEAVSVAGQRLVATSAVRCVGNTLLLNGEVFSPPFRVVAIGPAGPMQQRLDASPGVGLFRQAAEYFGLGYDVEPLAAATVPAYAGPVGLQYARPGA